MQELNERTKLLYRPVNDVGGLPREPLNLTEHPLQPWEKRCHALLESLNARGVLTHGGEAARDRGHGPDDLRRAHLLREVGDVRRQRPDDQGALHADELAEQIAQVRRRFEEGT
jgi:hypothetical protein